MRAPDPGRLPPSGLRAADGALQTDDGGIDVNFAPESDATVNLHTDGRHITAQRAPDGGFGLAPARSGSGRGAATHYLDRQRVRSP